MWILNFLPSWIYQAFVLIGLVGITVSIFTGFFSRFIPTLLLIKLPLQIISIGFLVFGVYLWGGIANQEMWEARVKEMQDKVAIAEQKSKEVNTNFKVPFYPILPILFSLFSLILVVNSIIETPSKSAIGLGLVLLGLPIYFLLKKK